MPVLLGDELLDLALAISHELQRHRLDAPGAEASPHLVPQQRADFVADEAVENAAGSLRGHHLLIDDAGILQRILDRLLADLVEHEAVYLPLLAAELVRQMPADRLSLAIRVGGDVDVGRLFGCVLQLFDDFLPGGDRFVLLGKVVLDVDP